MNTKQQGDRGVAQAISWYTDCGHTVSLPFGDSARYDLIVDRGSKLYRVQVKTCAYKRPNSPSFCVQLATCGGNMSGTGKIKPLDKTEFDLLFVVTDDGTMYEFPAMMVDGKSKLTLSPDKGSFRLNPVTVGTEARL